MLVFGRSLVDSPPNIQVAQSAATAASWKALSILSFINLLLQWQWGQEWTEGPHKTWKGTSKIHQITGAGRAL